MHLICSALSVYLTWCIVIKKGFFRYIIERWAMKSSNRFLLGFGIGLGVLVLITIIMVIVSDRQTTVYPENTPEGVVQRFLQAEQSGDFQKAYSYTYVEQNGKRLTLQDLMPYYSRPPGYQTSSWRATLGRATTAGNTSVVEVIVDRFQSQGPFGNPIFSQTVLFNLTSINGTWYITSPPPYLFY